MTPDRTSRFTCLNPDLVWVGHCHDRTLRKARKSSNKTQIVYLGPCPYTGSLRSPWRFQTKNLLRSIHIFLCMFGTQQRVVEKVVENGHVVRDIDMSLIRPNPGQFLIQGLNRNVPFVATNMSPKTLQSVFQQTRQQQPKRTYRKKATSSSSSHKRKLGKKKGFKKTVTRKKK